MTSVVQPAAKKVAIIGAGYIATYHLQCLASLQGIEVTAVCDPDTAASSALQARWGIEHRFPSIDALLDQHQPDIVHIVTPPSSHANLAERCLSAGVSVFLEKPMALDGDEANRLVALTDQHESALLAVNHNALYFPAFQKLTSDVATGRMGTIEHLSLVINTPMRQLETMQVGHWAFSHPGNLVFESLYHPLTQIHDLVGPALNMELMTTGRRELTPGRDIFDTWSLSLECQRGTAQLYFSCAKAIPSYTVVALGQEGVAQLDVLNNGYRFQGRTRYPWFIDSSIWHLYSAGKSLKCSVGNVGGFALSTLKLAEPNDPFTKSINESIHAFYAAYLGGTVPRGDAKTGRVVVDTCERLSTLAANKARVPGRPSAPRIREAGRDSNADKADILVIGANGFIGQHLVKNLVAKGRSMRVLVRNPHQVPAALVSPHIHIYRGDITDVESLLRAMNSVRFVYHLAGTAKDTWEATRALIVDGTCNVAEACRTSLVQRLIYTSTIATYYLGGPDPIREDSPLDPIDVKRSHYARAKILSERALRDFEQLHGLEVVICRPGVVIGPGGRPFHSAVGTWPNSSHVIGWGTGNHPMPLVLVQDCAEALARIVDIQQLDSNSFNLVGDVRLTPQEYVRALSSTLGRRISFHSAPLISTYTADLFKWLVKVVTRRPGTVFPSWRDLATRSQRAQFDTTKTKTALRWQPESDLAAFNTRGIGYLAPTEESDTHSVSDAPHPLET